MSGVLPHRRPVDPEPLGDRQHALAVRPSGSNSFYFLLRQGGSTTSTRVLDDVETFVEHERRRRLEGQGSLFPRGVKAFQPPDGFRLGTLGSTSTSSLRNGCWQARTGDARCSTSTFSASPWCAYPVLICPQWHRLARLADTSFDDGRSRVRGAADSRLHGAEKDAVRREMMRLLSDETTITHPGTPRTVANWMVEWLGRCSGRASRPPSPATKPMCAALHRSRRRQGPAGLAHRRPGVDRRHHPCRVRRSLGRSRRAAGRASRTGCGRRPTPRRGGGRGSSTGRRLSRPGDV